MSRSEKLDEEIRELKQRKLIEQHHRCGNPKCPKYIGEEAQLAHRIPQRGWCIVKWGQEVVHHPDNMVLVCDLDCNAAVQLNPVSLQAVELAKAIQAKLKGGERNAE